MRLPLTPQVSTKDGAANKNARLTNMLREKDKAVVRPGLSLVLDYAGVGNGLVPFNDNLIGIFDDTVYDLDASGTAAASGGGGTLDLTTVDATPVALDFADWDATFTYPLGWKVMYTGVECTSLQNGNVGNTPSEGSQWWLGIGGGPKATGGTVTTDGAYTIHTFTADGTFTVLLAPLIVDYLVVGGGGAASFGGGGAGGLLYVTEYEMDAGPNTVTIGVGGVTTNGGDTTFIATVEGGGAGGDGSSEITALGGNGACGGGGGCVDNQDPPYTYAGGTGGIGFDGGIGVKNTPFFNYPGGGGGGGMGAAGTDAQDFGDDDVLGGNGGDGVQNDIDGTLAWYCGGGAGFDGQGRSVPGEGFLGPGGGGTMSGSSSGTNGIVIIRYLT